MTTFFAAVIAFIEALLGRKKPDSQTKEAEHALAAKQHEAAVFAAPLPDDSALDAIVHEHNRTSR